MKSGGETLVWCFSEKLRLRAPFFDSCFAPAFALIDGSFGNWIYLFLTAISLAGEAKRIRL